MQCSKAQRTSGFTIVEMLVVAPMIIIIIGVLIAAMVALTSSVVVSNTEGSATYDIQSALDQIEQDVRLATSVGTLADDDMTLVPMTSPLLILGQYATDRNPTDPARELIYTSTSSNPCNTTSTLNGKLWKSNPPVKISIIYHIVNGTLWRRTIVPVGATFSSSSPAANNVCGQMWQQSTCLVKNRLLWPCSAANTDTRVLTNVASDGFVIRYFNSIASTSGSSNPSANTSAVKVTLKTAATAAGQDVTATGSMKAKITNY